MFSHNSTALTIGAMLMLVAGCSSEPMTPSDTSSPTGTQPSATTPIQATPSQTTVSTPTLAGTPSTASPTPGGTSSEPVTHTESFTPTEPTNTEPVDTATDAPTPSGSPIVDPCVFPLNEEVLAENAGSVINGSAGEQFGYSSTMCDVNGDSTPDVVIGAPLARDGLGTVYIFFQRDHCRDYPSFATEADAVYHGTEANENAGTFVGCGDVNADGIGDLLVGSPQWNGDQGRLAILLGSQSISGELMFTAELHGEDADALGTSAAVLLREDATPLIAVGAPQNGVGASSTAKGQVLLYDWNDGEPIQQHVITGERPRDAFGATLLTLNWDGDGDDELFVGAPFADGNNGAAVNGGSVALFDITGAEWSSSLSVDDAMSAYYGASLANAGTTIAHSGSTVAIGAIGHNSTTGGVAFIHNSTPSGELQFTLTGSSAEDEFGQGLAGNGSLLFVGSRTATDNGAVSVFTGTTSSGSITTNIENAFLGFSINVSNSWLVVTAPTANTNNGAVMLWQLP